MAPGPFEPPGGRPGSVLMSICDSYGNHMTARNLQLREVLREGEIYLEDQLKIAIASDSRAMAFAAASSNIAIALIGAAAYAFHQKTYGVIVAWALAFGALGYFACALTAFASTRSSTFFYRGNDPSEWYSDIASARDLDDSLEEMLKFYADNISNNAHVIYKSHKFFNRSLNIFMMTSAYVCVSAMIFFVYLSQQWSTLALPR